MSCQYMTPEHPSKCYLAFHPLTLPQLQVGKILEVEASDADTGHNAELLYSVTDTVKFEVDANGAVSVKVTTGGTSRELS